MQTNTDIHKTMFLKKKVLENNQTRTLILFMPGMVTQTRDPNTRKAETGVEGQGVLLDTLSNKINQ